MKFIDLELSPYGHFESHRIVFGDNAHSFNLVYGDNEAGKSTTLRAVEGFLFGIPRIIKDDFLFTKSELRIKAELETAMHGRLSLVRRKGDKNTLLDREGRPVDDDLIAAALGGLDRAVFSKMYGLDHSALVNGADALLKGGGSLAEILFQAGTGVAALRPRLKKLEDEAKSQFAPSTKNQSAAFNKARQAYASALVIVKENSAPPRKFTELDNEITKKTGLAKEKKRELNDLKSQKDHLERLKMLLPHYQKRSAMLNELSALSGVPELDEKTSENRAKYQEAVAHGLDTRAALEASIEILKTRISSAEYSDILLSQSEVIRTWCAQRARHEQAAIDLIKIQQERAGFESRSIAILRDIGSTITLDDVESIRISILQRQKIESLIDAGRALTVRRENLKADIENLQKKQRESTGGFAAHGIAGSIADLKLALTQAQDESQTDRLIAELDLEINRLAEDAAVKLKQLTCWQGTLEDLEGLAVPSSETIDLFDKRHNKIALDLAGSQKELEACKESLDNETRALEVFLHEGDVPTPEALKAARERRDYGWQLVHEAWADGDSVEKCVPDFDSDATLSKAFEESIALADANSDRLREDANRVAEYAAHVTKKQECRLKLDAANDALLRCRNERQQYDNAWSAIWDNLSVSPLSPSEMRSWLTKQQALVQIAASLREKTLRRSALGIRRTEIIECLKSGLIKAGDLLPATADNLLSMAIAYSVAVYSRIDEEDRSALQIKKEIAKIDIELNEKRDLLKLCDEQITAWRTDWKASVATIGLDGDTSPQIAQTALNRLGELFNLVDQIISHLSREQGIGRDAAMFHDQGITLLQNSAPDLTGMPDLDAAGVLSRRLEEMEKEKTKREGLEEQLAQKEHDLATANAAIANAESRLQELIAAAGCSTASELQIIEQSALRVRHLRSEIVTETAYLNEGVINGSLDPLLEELGQIDPDRIDQDIDNLQLRIDTEQPEYDAVHQELGALSDKIKAMDGKAAAADAALLAQDAAAQMSAAVDRYMRVRLSSILLKRYIDQYQKANQGPVLLEASRIFSGLTLGSFSGLRTDFDDRDESILLGVRGAGKDVAIDGMSDGTRDALYLALRLASLHHYFSTHEPMPFIVDDILINLDDRRAAAAFTALAELATKTQVIFFTHHNHLCDLAKNTVPSERLAVHNFHK
jgi:uncharacterized protein YhaN